MTVIKIKNSSVAGKAPVAGDIVAAELALNLADKKLYSKDANDNIFEIGASEGANVPGGPTPPTNGNEIGDLFFDTVNNQLLYWDGSQWVPIAGDEVQKLDDLEDVTILNPAAGELLVWNGSEWANSDPGYLTEAEINNILNGLNPDGTNNPGAEEYAKLSDIKDGKLTIKDADDNVLGEFTANQEAPSEIIIPAAKWEDIEGNPITIGGTQPGNPSIGDIWIDTSDCPPTLNIYDDCDDPGNPIWKPIGGGGGSDCVQGPVQITSSNGTGLNSTLTAVGGNGVDDGASLSATYEWTGAKTGSGASVVADVEGVYTVTATINCTDGSTLSSTAVWTITDTYVDMVNNTAPVIAVVGAGEDEAYEGNSLYVVSNATVLNGESPSIIETQWFKDGVADGTGSVYTIGAGDETKAITAKQLFRDLRSNELLSDASNGITIVDRPAGAITFAAVITDDGTPNANTPGHVLTASAENIQGGVAPVEYEYKWLVGGLTMGTNKTLNIIQTFVGQVVSCEVTVAEPDGSNPETRTAVYDKVIEVAGTIDTPEVLAPADGAGSGTSRYLKSDTIIDVEDVGGGQIKLTVDGSTDLADMSGASFMSDGTGAPGPYSQTPYKLVTSEITDVQKDSQADWTGLNNLYGSDSTYVAGGGTNGSVVNKEYAFNGNVPGINNVSKSQNAYSDNGAASIIYWRPDPALIQSIFGDLTSIRIRIDAVSGRTVNNVLWLNGANVEVTSSEYGKSALGNDSQWLSVDTVPTSLTADGIAVQGGNVSTGRIGAIELNGILLVDNSELITLTFASPNPDLKYFKAGDLVQSGSGFNSSQTWASFFSPDSVPTDAPFIDAFDGALNTYLQTTSLVEMTWTPSAGLTGTTLKLYFPTGDPGAGTINFSDDSSIGMADNGWVEQEIMKVGTYDISGKTFTSMVWQGDGSANKTYLTAIEIDGTLLVDPSKDIQAVKIVSPPDLVANTMVVDGGAWDDSDHSKAWSSYFANYTIVPNITTGIPSNAFDGTDNTAFSSQHYSDTLVWEYPSGYTFTDKVEVYFYHSEHTVKVNNSTTAIDIDKREWVTVATGGGTLQKLTVENTIAVGAPVKSWAMLRIDGNLLIDKANKTKVWSQYGSGNHYDASYNWESVFSYGTAGGYPAVTDSITWTPDGGFEFDTEFAISSKVGYSNMDRPDRILPVITGEFETAGPFEIFRDDSRFAGTATSYVKLADGPDKLISFTVYNNGNGAYDAAQLFSVFGDGEQLIDTGVLGIGLDRAEYQTNGGEGEIVSVNTDDNTIMLTETGDRDNRWIAENKAGTDFYVAGPQIVDDPLLTTDVELESSLFATTPDNADTLKNIVWELNGAEQNAGTSNPYKPSGLALNTEYTVRVKHQGNALEDSAWSPSTTFTTGATRNLYTYYKERVDALVARVEALENP